MLIIHLTYLTFAHYTEAQLISMKAGDSKSNATNLYLRCLKFYLDYRMNA